MGEKSNGSAVTLPSRPVSSGLVCEALPPLTIVIKHCHRRLLSTTATPLLLPPLRLSLHANHYCCASAIIAAHSHHLRHTCVAVLSRRVADGCGCAVVCLRDALMTGSFRSSLLCAGSLHSATSVGDLSSSGQCARADLATTGHTLGNHTATSKRRHTATTTSATISSRSTIRPTTTAAARSAPPYCRLPVPGGFPGRRRFHHLPS